MYATTQAPWGLWLLGSFAVLFPLLGAVAYLTYAERKVIGFMQQRHGPSTVGFWGLLQPIADAVKLLTKQRLTPISAPPLLYALAPVFVLVPALLAWAVIPFHEGALPFYGELHAVLADINFGVLYLLAVSSVGIYGILLAGWGSNSKYPFLGAIRSGAQMISYEIPLGLCVLSVLLLAQTFNLTELVQTQQNVAFGVNGYWLPLFPMAIIFLITILAETNRAPFDLPEAEAELVAGYNTEYGSANFAAFFMGEYANMILMSAFAVLLFFGGWLPPIDWAPLYGVPGFVWFFGKIAMILFVFLWTRATLPRFRYDQLMHFGWKFLLPVTFGFVVCQIIVLKVWFS